jgi:hypothetical protein
MAAVHDRHRAPLLDHIGLDIEPKFNRGQPDPEKSEQQKQRDDVGCRDRKRHQRQKDRKAEDEGVATADPPDELAGKRQHQEDAGRKAKQRDGQFGGAERQPLLDTGNLRQPAAKGDRLQEEGCHDDTIGMHERHRNQRG